MRIANPSRGKTGAGVCDMNRELPGAKSSHSPHEREKLKRIIAQRNLSGLANDTKWDEFITSMRSRDNWLPRYKYKCVDSHPSSWDGEWFYHLPFPLISIEWLDITFLQEQWEHRLPARVEVIDHSDWIEGILRQIGLDYRKGNSVIRIFGYFPRDLEHFDEPFGGETH